MQLIVAFAPLLRVIDEDVDQSFYLFQFIVRLLLVDDILCFGFFQQVLQFIVFTLNRTIGMAQRAVREHSTFILRLSDWNLCSMRFFCSVIIVTFCWSVCSFS